MHSPEVKRRTNFGEPFTMFCLAGSSGLTVAAVARFVRESHQLDKHRGVVAYANILVAKAVAHLGAGHKRGAEGHFKASSHNFVRVLEGHQSWHVSGGVGESAARASRQQTRAPAGASYHSRQPQESRPRGDRHASTRSKGAPPLGAIAGAA
eukprot:scaffold4280_cov385-Prasinococcus_capsulatus_cf.AAC.1